MNQLMHEWFVANIEPCQLSHLFRAKFHGPVFFAFQSTICLSIFIANFHSDQGGRGYQFESRVMPLMPYSGNEWCYVRNWDWLCFTPYWLIQLFIQKCHFTFITCSNIDGSLEYSINKVVDIHLHEKLHWIFLCRWLRINCANFSLNSSQCVIHMRVIF